MRDTVVSKTKENVREHSFGAAPPKMKIQGGSFCTFGHQTHEDQVWPKPVTTVNQKTGFPEGHMGKSKDPGLK